MAPLPLFAAAVLQATTPEPKIDIEPLGPDRHRIVVTGLEEDDRVSQAVSAQIAARICGAKRPDLGRFEATRRIRTPSRSTVPARFSQEVTCTLVAPAGASATRTSFTPDAAADASARSAATAFLGDYLAGNGAASWRRLTATMRAQQPEPAWTAQAKRQAAAVGADPRVTIAKLTWYVDPPGVPAGVYAAADYVGSSDASAALCGFVALNRDASGGWSVSRIEFGALPRAAARSMDAATLARLRRELRCVDGPG